MIEPREGDVRTNPDNLGAIEIWTQGKWILIEPVVDVADLRAENETLRRDVKTAVMGDSAELQDVKRENEKLREALKSERERCAKIAEQARDDTCDGPVAWSMADGIAAAIRESE